MSQAKGFGDKVAFVWSVADLLRGDFKAHEYGQVILPFVVLRRLECALAATKPAVLARAAKVQGKFENVEPLLLHESGQRFFNTSELDLSRIMQDPPNAAANLRTYLAGFSAGAQEVLDKYGFDAKITRLADAKLLYQVIGKFAELDLSVDAVSNDAMGYIFEELLRRFSEMSNETAGEHFTPREVIRLMVNVLLDPDDKALSGAKPIRTIYDPACGTGGMLTVAQEHLASMNPNAELVAYGQELNPETWAICRSDLMIKGQDPSLVALGNSLIIGDQDHPGDGHPGKHFDYLLANPPFGVDWNKYADDVRDEAAKFGFDGRYGPGLPRVSDGSMLFLLHMISKFKPVADDPATADIVEGGSRMGIVLSPSPLSTGLAGQGESEIRRFILENDLLEGIIALPDQMFYNTDIGTYIWFLTNRKAPERRGKVILIDARDSGSRLPKSLGEKRKELTDAAIEEITRLFADALTSDDKRVKVMDRNEFGFARLTVEQPLRRVWEVAGETFTSEAAATKRITETMADAGKGNIKSILKDCAKTDPSAAPVKAKKGGVFESDPALRDQRSIPLPAGWFDMSEPQREASVKTAAEEHLVAEVHPYVPDAWIDHSKTKVGFEISFTRQFHVYMPPRPVTQIRAEIEELETRIQEIMMSLSGHRPIQAHHAQDAAPEWLGRLPAGWQVRSPRTLFTERREPSRPGDEHLTPSQTLGVLPQREYMELTGNHVVLNLSGADNMKHVEPGDFIIHLRSFQGGLEFSGHRGKVSNAYTVLTPIGAVDATFLKWLLKSAGFIQELAATTQQLRDGQSIKLEQFSRVPLPLPPLEVQVEIAKALDAEVAKLDDLAGLLEAQAEAVREYKRSLITVSVTGEFNATTETGVGGKHDKSG